MNFSTIFKIYKTIGYVIGLLYDNLTYIGILLILYYYNCSFLTLGLYIVAFFQKLVITYLYDKIKILLTELNGYQHLHGNHRRNLANLRTTYRNSREELKEHFIESLLLIYDNFNNKFYKFQRKVRANGGIRKTVTSGTRKKISAIFESLARKIAGGDRRRRH